MKKVKRVKYLSTSEACWYVGMDVNFLEIFVQQGKLQTIGEAEDRHFELGGLNAIKDILADDFGEQMVSSEGQVSINIGDDPRVLISPASILCGISACLSLACIVIVVWSLGWKEIETPRTVFAEDGKSLNVLNDYHWQFHGFDFATHRTEFDRSGSEEKAWAGEPTQASSVSK